MAMHAVNMAEWDTLQSKTEKTPISSTNRVIEVNCQYFVNVYVEVFCLGQHQNTEK